MKCECANCRDVLLGPSEGLGTQPPRDGAESSAVPPALLSAYERLERGCRAWGRAAKLPTETCHCENDEKPPMRTHHSGDPHCVYYVNWLYEEAHAEVAAALGVISAAKATVPMLGEAPK